MANNGEIEKDSPKVSQRKVFAPSSASDKEDYKEVNSQEDIEKLSE